MSKDAELHDLYTDLVSYIKMGYLTKKDIEDIFGDDY